MHRIFQATYVGHIYINVQISWKTLPALLVFRNILYTINRESGNKNSSLASTLKAWWHHQMETFSALLAICVGNPPVTGELPAQRPVTRSFDVFFDLRLNKRLTKQSWVWWFETPSRPLWRHCKGYQSWSVGLVLFWTLHIYIRWRSIRIPQQRHELCKALYSQW